MTRASIIALSLVTVALVLVLSIVVRLIEADRRALVQRFTDERVRQLDEAAREIGEDFDDIAEDLRFAGKLVDAADTATDRRRELGALIAVVHHYRLIRIFDPGGSPVLTVRDPGWTSEIASDVFDAELARVAARAREGREGAIENSGRLEGDPTGWLRAFAAPLPARAGAIVVVVDVEPLFRQLRLLSALRSTRLLVLGVDGRPAPVTDEHLAHVVDTAPDDARVTATLLARMRAGERGTLRLPAAEAVRLHLGTEEAIAAYGPVDLSISGHWAVATVSGTGALRASERAVMLRTGFGAAASAFCLLLFGAYVVLAERRAAAAQERLRQAGELGRLQAQLLRAEKMATVGVLAAGIAHEIGTPLGIVRARAEMTAAKLGADHAQARSLHVITEQIDRVSRTIRQLLDFSRVRPVAVQAVELTATVRTVQELLVWECERRGITLASDMPGELPPIAADPDQLQQVLVNLLMNGLDACGRGGRVEVRARQEPEERGVPPLVRIEVKDSGCGIPAELRHQVFDPFFTTKKRGQGTGLGLTMAARIVESHAAELELDSVPGQGTRMILRWPVAPIPGETPARAPSP